jgi:hypothetical protein
MQGLLGRFREIFAWSGRDMSIRFPINKSDVLGVSLK